MSAVATAAQVALGATAASSCLYYLVSAWCLRRWFCERPVEESGAAPLPPVTFFRPLKSGLPGLRKKLEVLATALRPGDQLLVGVEPESAEEGVATDVARAFAEKEIAVLRCEAGRARNPKISKLLQMAGAARHEHWIVSDSEAALDTAFLEKFLQEWRQCDVLTAGYRFEGARTWPQRLDAVAILLTLWPGLAVLRAAGPMRLTLGACTGFRRGDLAAVGGWAAFGNDLAEDHRLGVALAAAGCRIRLSRAVVALESDPLSSLDYWRHQRRVAITYRVANPLGFAGAWAAQGVTAALLLVGAYPVSACAWAALVLTLAARVASVRAMGRCLGLSTGPGWREVFLASVVETLCWALSWTARSVWWGGTRWRIGHGGRLRPMEG